MATKRVVRQAPEEQRSEKKGLAIAGLVIGILGLLLSWVPIINNLAFIFAILGFIFALIAVIANRKRKKGLSVAALVISIVAGVIVISTQGMYKKAIDDTTTKVSTAISSSQKAADTSFKWKIADYDALTVGDTVTGVGGESYASVVAKFGKASSSSDSTSGDITMKVANWNNMGSSTYKSVSLTFMKQADGSFLLSSKNQTGLQ